MQRIHSASAVDLFDIAASRRIEQTAAAGLPPHALMQRAGLAVARLAMAVAPHARTIWVACGPGNNGGDGFEAAMQLHQRGFPALVTRIGEDTHLPPDARLSLERARAAGVPFAAAPPPHFDLAVDALLGMGASRPLQGSMAEWLQLMLDGRSPVLCVDTPSGLDGDTGVLAPGIARAASAANDATPPRRLCLSLLTLKPGLFTADGQDAAGQVWFDDLAIDPGTEAPVARLAGARTVHSRLQATHKGSYGDVAVVGGAPGMAGAALLAGSAALAGGAGRVFVAPLDKDAGRLDVSRPELMFRSPESLDLASMTVVCGCGGGSAVQDVLPQVIQTSRRLVIDADALNAIARDGGLQALLQARQGPVCDTVLTPHPLEAARLLGCDAKTVQADRLHAARKLADRFGAVVVLKGSGTVIAAPEQTSVINITGNARLATAGTGDVLAGMIGAALAAGRPAMQAALDAVWHHGDLADRWPSDLPLTSGALASGHPGISR